MVFTISVGLHHICGLFFIHTISVGLISGCSIEQYFCCIFIVQRHQAIKIPAVKAAVDKEWETLEKISAWNLAKVRNKSEVTDEARNKSVKAHFASLMDLCDLKNAELEDSKFSA